MMDLEQISQNRASNSIMRANVIESSVASKGWFCLFKHCLVHRVKYPGDVVGVMEVTAPPLRMSYEIHAH